MSVELQDDELYDLSDEALEAAFKEAKSQENAPEDDVEDDQDVDNAEEDFEEEVIEDEEEVEDMEHPEDQDSDDDTSSEDEDEDSDEEETEEADEDNSDESSEEDEAEPTEDEEDSEEEEQPAQEERLRFKANGQEFDFTIPEMKEQFGKVFGQAMDYTKKMQQIKPWRKTIDAIEQAELSNEDISLMIDVLKGDKDAIADVLKRTGVDALDLDTENSKYIAKDYGRNDTELAIKDIIDEISGDKEYATTHNVLEKQWDDKSRDMFIEDPELIKLLHVDVKSGAFDTLNPIAQKLKVFDNGKKSDLDYYKQAAQQHYESQAQERTRLEAAEKVRVEKEAKALEAKKLKETKAKQAQRKATKQASSKRKAAAPAKKAAGTKKVTDYLDDSDEAFDEWYNALQDSL